MKLLVIHDRQGNIESLAVPGPELAGRIQMVPQKGKFVTEVDAPEIAGDILDQKNHERFLNIIQSYRIEVGRTRGVLVPRARLRKGRTRKTRST